MKAFTAKVLRREQNNPIVVCTVFKALRNKQSKFQGAYQWFEDQLVGNACRCFAQMLSTPMFFLEPTEKHEQDQGIDNQDIDHRV